MTLMDQPGLDRPGDGARLAIYRLVPTPARNDRRFARDALHGEVVVRAYSPDDARRVAAEAERSAQAEAHDGESPFADLTLYTVIEVPGVDFLRSGTRGLIAGRFADKPVLE
jgi:hypothetical protein